MFKKFLSYDENEDIKDVKDEIETVASQVFCILKIRSYTDTGKVVKLIKERKIVVFSLEDLKSDEGQRVIDYVGGSTFALDGKVEKITDKVYASIPNGISVEHILLDEQDK